MNVDWSRNAPSNTTIQFVRAEIPSAGSPFVRVYLENGREEKYALRLDVDKRVFLDHLSNPTDDQFIHNSAKIIADLVSDEILKRSEKELWMF